VDEIHHFFENRDWSISISGRRLQMKVSQLDLNQFTMQVWDTFFTYRMRRWIGLNQQNWQRYQDIGDAAARIAFLERKLTGNILSLAKGIGWHVERPIETRIDSCSEPRPARVKGVMLGSFDLRFRSNVFLPNDLGLGKNVSLGYGTLWMERKRKEAQAMAERSSEPEPGASM
jgi:hypothetical protein